MRALLVAALVALCAAPVAARDARQRHPRPDHGRIIHELPNQRWRGNHGYRPHRGYGNYGYHPYRSFGYGDNYGYGYRSSPLCTYWTRGYAALDWYGNPYWVPSQPFVASCW